jgi:hypothetical protein
VATLQPVAREARQRRHSRSSLAGAGGLIEEDSGLALQTHSILLRSSTSWRNR